MNGVTIRNGRKSDLPAINQLIFQLISTLDKKESIDPEFISRKSRSLFRSASSHFLVAEAGKTIVGFAHFTTRGTITHRGLSGMIDELVVKGFPSEGNRQEIAVSNYREVQRAWMLRNRGQHRGDEHEGKSIL